MRILVVEDDPALGATVCHALELELHTVDLARTLKAARAALASTTYDLALVDLGLPDGDGNTMISELRHAGSALPIVVISARDQIAQRVDTLDQGADDYLVKPFDLSELLARVRAAARRRAPLREQRVQLGNWTVDLLRREVRDDRGVIALNPREYQVLAALVERRGRTVSRRDLEDAVAGWNEEFDSNAIEVHIHHLRRKLGVALIRTVRRFGYVID